MCARCTYGRMIGNTDYRSSALLLTQSYIFPHVFEAKEMLRQNPRNPKPVRIPTA